MATATGVYRNVYRSADHAVEADVRLSTVYNNGQLTGTLDPGASSDVPAESDVRLGVVYDNTTKTGNVTIPDEAQVLFGFQYDTLLSRTGTLLGADLPTDPILCNVAVDVTDQFGERVIGAEVYAVTKADVPGANDQLVLEQKVTPFLTDVSGRAIMPLIRGSEFSDPTNNKYRIITSTGRNPSEFEFLVPDLDFVVATDSSTLPPP